MLKWLDRLLGGRRRPHLPVEKELNSQWRVILGDYKTNSAVSDSWGTETDEDREKAQNAHALIFACLRKIVTAFHEAPYVHGTVGPDGFIPSGQAHTHPVVRLLHRPNPELSAPDFVEYHISHLLTTGKSFIWKWRNPLGQVSELWPIPSHWVTVVPLGKIVDDRRFIAQYIVRVSGSEKAVVVPVEDMIYTRFVHPGNFTDGIGPLEAARKDYKLDLERMEYMVEMLLNLRVPGLIVKQEVEYDEAQKAEMRQALTERVGKKRRGSPLFLFGEGASVEMVAPLKDLDWPGLSGLSESRICAAFGVPPLLVHARVAQENSPLSSPNLEAASRVFYAGTMSSLWLHDGYSMTLGLLASEGYPEDHAIRHDLSGVLALQEDLEKTAKVVDTAVKAGVMTLAEGRERLGLELDPNTEGVYLLPMGSQPIKSEQLLLPVPEPGEPDPDPDPDSEFEEEWEREEEVEA